MNLLFTMNINYVRYNKIKKQIYNLYQKMLSSTCFKSQTVDSCYK